MKIRPRYSSTIAMALNAYGLTLYPFIFFMLPKDDPRCAQVQRHEMIHVRQIRRRSFGWLRFYVGYGVQYVAGRLRGLSHYAAYMAITTELEAYANQDKIALSDEEKAELGL